jgi:hypothetical protein
MRSRMRFLPLVLLFLAPLGLIRCGQPAQACNAETCATGCCDDQGVCQSGTQSNTCGTAGAACTNCLSAGQTCVSQVCTGSEGQPDAGMADAGATDAGMTDAGMTDAGMTDGGMTDAGMVTCTTIDGFTATSTSAGFSETTYAAPWDFVVAAYLTQEISATSYNELDVEIWKDSVTNAFRPVPFTHTFDPAIGYDACEICVLYFENCAGQSCQRYYYAVGGTLTVTDRTLDKTVGVLQAETSSLRLVEWDYQNEVPEPGGQCIDLVNFNLTATWDNSSMDAGLPLDAGTEPDAGMDMDGGAIP